MSTTDKPTTTASATPDKVRTLDHRTLEGANTNKAPKGVRDKTYKYFGVSKAEYEAAQTASAPETRTTAPTHVELVHVRQELGTEIKRLQLRLSTAGQRNGEMQGTIATLQGENDHLGTHAAKLAEALSHSADKLSDLSEWLKAYVEPKQAASVKAVETEAREALAAYESEVRQ